MFSEYSDLIARLKHEGINHRALHLIARHEELDQQIAGMEERNAGDSHTEIGALKKEKLRVKDELYGLLRDIAAA